MKEVYQLLALLGTSLERELEPEELEDIRALTDLMRRRGRASSRYSLTRRGQAILERLNADG